NSGKVTGRRLVAASITIPGSERTMFVVFPGTRSRDQKFRTAGETPFSAESIRISVRIANTTAANAISANTTTAAHNRCCDDRTGDGGTSSRAEGVAGAFSAGRARHAGW